MPPPGYEPFLRAICENPEDDAVRLVYADWLQENGDEERAEFIRLQIEYQSQPAEFDARYARMVELRKRRGQEWRTEFPITEGVTYGQFRRGFIDRVAFRHFRAFADHGAAVLSQVPACDVRLCQSQSRDVPAIVGSPHAPRFTFLRVNAGIAGAEVVDQLVTAGWEWNLRELDLTAWGPNARHPFRPLPMINDVAAARLLRATVFPHLHTLRLTGISLSAGVYSELLERFGNGLYVWPRMSS